MSVNAIIMKVLPPFGYPVVPEIYTGNEKYYITFNRVADAAKRFADNEPGCTVVHIQVHFFMPLLENSVQTNHLRTTREIREALFKAGFTYPEVTILIEPENNVKHVVLECAIQEEREEQ